MGITFEQIDATPTPPAPAEARIVLPLAAAGVGDLDAVGAVGTLTLLLSVGNEGAEPDTPILPASADIVLPLLAFASGGEGYAPAEANITLPLSLRAVAENGWGDIRLSLSASGSYLAPINEDDLPEYPIIGVTSRLFFGSPVTGAAVAVFRDRFGVRSQGHGSAQATSRITDDLGLSTALAAIYRELVSEALGLGAADTLDAVAIARVAERVLLRGEASSYAEAVQVIIAALAMADVLDAFSRERIADGLDLGDALADRLMARQQQVDALLASAGVSDSALLVAAVNESLTTGEGINDTLEAVQAVRESLGLTLRFSLGNDEYVCWVMNAASKGLTTYRQFPFNSFARIGGRYYGAIDTGVHRLEGPDDDGAAIRARVRGAVTRMGTGRQKRLPSVYLGYTAEGALLIRMVVQSDEGDDAGKRVAHTYRLHAQTAEAMRSARVKVGKGLRAVYYGFELENVDGGDFDIDSIEFLPLGVERRTRGEGGGKR